MFSSPSKAEGSPYKDEEEPIRKLGILPIFPERSLSLVPRIDPQTVHNPDRLPGPLPNILLHTWPGNEICF